MDGQQDQVGEILGRIQGRLGARRGANEEDFVEPQPRIVEQLASPRHHFVQGRRGAGKSTVLSALERHAARNGIATVFVDLEELRGREYPDVVIELFLRLLAVLRATISDRRAPPTAGKREVRAAIAEIRLLEDLLENLLGEPKSVRRTVNLLRKSGRSRSGKLSLNLERISLPLSGHALGAGSSERTVEDRAEATFVQTKMDGLFEGASALRSTLERGVRVLGAGRGMIILDEFHHIVPQDQPEVLA